MKWIKHLTATWNDEKVSRLIGKGGWEGMARYGLLWRVREIVAEQMDGDSDRCSATFNVTRWSHLLSLRGSLLRHWLDELAVSGLVTVEWIGDDIRVTIPNLLKYRDEYSEKSRHRREKLHLQQHTHTDTEKETTTTPEPDPEVDTVPNPSGFTGKKVAAVAEIPPEPVRQTLHDAGIGRAGILKIWAATGKALPDRSAEEVVSRFEAAAARVSRQRGLRNPPGLLIDTVEDWFDPLAVLAERGSPPRESKPIDAAVSLEQLLRELPDHPQAEQWRTELAELGRAVQRKPMQAAPEPGDSLTFAATGGAL